MDIKIKPFIPDKVPDYNRTIAVMDLGTNTFHLLIIKQEKDNLQVLYKTKVAVKLGENGISSGFISEEPFKRGVTAMVNFSSKLKEYNPSKIIATGTAAIRNAQNKNQFLKAIQKESGINVQVIDGNKEAKLIYEGVKHAMAIGLQKSLIMDIGGGSVEFILADEKKIYWKHSFELGAALLLEKFNPANPITPIQVKKINSYLKAELEPLIEAAMIFKPVRLIGSSGSFDTFAEMIAWQFYDPGILRNKTSWDFDMKAYDIIHLQLLASTLSGRKKMKGLLQMRIDMIVVASILLTFVLNKLKLSKMTLSTYALKEGVMWKMLNNEEI